MNRSNEVESLLPPEFDDLMLRQVIQQFFANTFNAILITTAGKGYPIVYANPAFCHMTGYGLEELRGKSPSMFQGASSSVRVLQRLREALATGGNFHGATINYRKDGSSYPVEWNISPIFDESGRVAYYLSVQKDLSSLKDVMSRLKRTNQNFRAFLRDISGAMNSGNMVDVAQEVADHMGSLTPQLLDNVRLYNPALRADENIDLFDEGEFFEPNGDEAGFLAEKIDVEVMSAAQYAARQSMSASDVAGLLAMFSEIEEQLDLLSYSSGKMKALSVIAESLHEASSTIFYLEDFVGISSVLSELAARTGRCSAADLPDFIIDIYRALMQDMQAWVDCIFVRKSAEDIHEMDASIISSARQLLVFIK